MPEKINYNNIGLLAQGGIAILHRIVLEDSTQAVLRQLQSSKIFSIAQQQNFRRGVKLRAMLSPHPNLANTISTGLNAIRPYEIIEYVEGKNLKVLMNLRDPVIQKERLFILQECAEALAWIHTNGFMHLDIKPENFLVHHTADKPLIKLTDFDLAQPANNNAPRKQMGTPAYMAPEQFKDKTAFLASDVFAFSIMAYQLITGKDPFPADTQKEALKRQASMTVVPKPLLEYAPDICPALNKVIMTGLEKKRDKRYPDMNAFLADFKNIKSASVPQN